jgi:hypothetical protein
MSNTLGVALTKCFFCLGPGAIVMNTRLTEQLARSIESMHDKVLDMTPCSTCKGYMKQGIVLMTFDPDQSEPDWNKERIPNPYRSGGFFVLKESAFKRLLTGSAVDFALKNRWIFVEHEVAEQLGLFDIAKKEKTDGEDSDEG